MLAGRPVRQQQLLRLVWPEDPPSAGSKALHVAVSRLRSWLRTEFPGTEIRRDQDCYRLVLADVHTDVTDFERLATAGLDPTHDANARVDDLTAALALWRGPVLDGHPIATRFPVVQHWDLTRVAVGCALADTALITRRHADALPMIAALAMDRPLDETLYAGWARVLLACGRQPEALAVLDTVRIRLMDGHGIEPGPVLRAAFQQALVPNPAASAQVGLADKGTPRTVAGSCPSAPLIRTPTPAYNVLAGFEVSGPWTSARDSGLVGCANWTRTCLAVVPGGVVPEWGGGLGGDVDGGDAGVARAASRESAVIGFSEVRTQ